jgi:hypothetical protein
MSDYLARVARSGSMTSAPARPPAVAPTIVPEVHLPARPPVDIEGRQVVSEQVTDESTVPDSIPAIKVPDRPRARPLGPIRTPADLPPETTILANDLIEPSALRPLARRPLREVRPHPAEPAEARRDDPAVDRPEPIPPHEPTRRFEPPPPSPTAAERPDLTVRSSPPAPSIPGPSKGPERIAAIVRMPEELRPTTPPAEPPAEKPRPVVVPAPPQSSRVSDPSTPVVPVEARRAQPHVEPRVPRPAAPSAPDAALVASTALPTSEPRAVVPPAAALAPRPVEAQVSDAPKLHSRSKGPEPPGEPRPLPVQNPAVVPAAPHAPRPEPIRAAATIARPVPAVEGTKAGSRVTIESLEIVVNHPPPAPARRSAPARPSAGPSGDFLGRRGLERFALRP